MTPLHESTRLAELLDIQLFIKRDDFYPMSGGGNKARKLDLIISSEVSDTYNAVVSTGSNHSNHMRATALRAAELGWKCILIVHDEKPEEYAGNLKIVSLSGAELRFVQKHEVKEAMDKAMDDLRESGYSPFYIWGGGHSIQGALAYYHAIEELSTQLKDSAVDYVVVASGTGTTQAGIHVGIKERMPFCKVLGVSVARQKERGLRAVVESAAELKNYLKIDVATQEVLFDDSKMGNGYGHTFPQLENTICWAAENEGLILDPVYTGKAFYGLREYVKDGTIARGSRVVFWHTGGLLNLMTSYH